MKKAKTITIDMAEVGQKLAEDVCDPHHHCLIAAGVVLNEAHFASLQARHVEYLTVWQEQHLSAADIAEQQAVIKTQMAQRFRKVLGNPDMRQLHELLLAWRLENFAAQEAKSKDEPCQP